MSRLWSAVVQVSVALGLVLFVTFGALFVGRQRVLQWQLDLPAFTHDVGEKRSEWVEMRDGVKLSTQVTLPLGEGPFPVVVIRNPYNLFDAFSVLCETFARYGYACVHQDVRGRMGSEGEWIPLVHERSDGLDLLAWLREQDFQNGRWGLWGMSYLAAVQWSMADALPPEVKTMVSMVFSVDSYRVVYEGGLFRHDVFSAWAAFMPDDDLALENGWAYGRMLRHLPPREADQAELGQVVPWYRSWVDAERPNDPAWSDPAFIQFRGGPEKIQVPVLMLGAYYDPFLDGQTRDFARLATRGRSKLVLGPWHHLQWQAADVSLEGDLGFGGQWGLFLDWLAHHLQDAPLQQAVGVVESYDIGARGWRQRVEFPPPASQARFHLLNMPAARTCEGGLLTAETAFPEQASAGYTYDPDDPTPSVGGASALAFAMRTFPSVEPGAKVQPGLCAREDLLSFVSEPLTEALHLVGAVTAQLRVSSDAEDTAFGIELMARSPGSNDWIHVREGYRTLAHRAGDAAAPVSYEPGDVVTVPIRSFPVEWTFPAGTQLRVDVRSASFPLYAAHANVAGRWGAAKTRRKAAQTLHPGSFVDLPVHESDAPVISGAALGTVPPAMACKFSIDLPDGAADIVAKAKKMIEEANGTFSGDSSTGTYTVKLPVGSVQGKYDVSGGAINFEITKKPMLVPCSAIESFLRDRLKSA